MFRWWGRTPRWYSSSCIRRDASRLWHRRTPLSDFGFTPRAVVNVWWPYRSGKPNQCANQNTALSNTSTITWHTCAFVRIWTVDSSFKDCTCYNTIYIHIPCTAHTYYVDTFIICIHIQSCAYHVRTHPHSLPYVHPHPHLHPHQPHSFSGRRPNMWICSNTKLQVLMYVWSFEEIHIPHAQGSAESGNSEKLFSWNCTANITPSPVVLHENSSVKKTRKIK